MGTINTSYTVLKYRHDSAAGEVLNFGVVLYSPETGEVGVAMSSRYGRLSEAFAGFEGELYKTVTRRFETALENLGRHTSEGLFQIEERQKYTDAGALVRAAWPDQGLAYLAGPVLFGITDDFERELRDLFDRFVLSQQDPRDVSGRLDDTMLWSHVRRVLSPRGITAVLKPKSLGPSDVEFDYAYKNHKWHVIEPVSFDYLNGSDIKQRALLTVGKAAAVRDVEDLGSFTVVVGRPRRIQAEKPFKDAMRLLRHTGLPGRIVDEDDLESFAATLEAEMRQHGLLPDGAVDADTAAANNRRDHP